MRERTGTRTMPCRFFIHIHIVLLVLFLSLSVSAQEPATVSYQLDLQNLKNHRITVKAEIPATLFTGEQPVVALPVWTPGSYKVRDYSRFLTEVTSDNPDVQVIKQSKNRWLLKGLKPGQDARLEYTVYGHELTVRTNYFTPDLSLLVGAATFLAPAPLRSEELPQARYRVTLENPQVAVSTALEKVGPQTYQAQDYDQLLDSPMVMGELTVHPFTAGGKPHSLVQAGDSRYWDTEKSLKDTLALVETQQNFWGSIPYERYIFQNLITDARGGLEHRNSTVVMTSRFATKDREDYLGWLSLLSHEFFHTWNVKRLRPAALGPFDYENEVYTRSLWIAEGITSYYDDLLVRRAGLSTRKEYLKALSKQLNRLLSTPGRQSTTLTDASFDAWIRLYQPTDDTHNSNISYYNKGAVVAWLLDTEIRRRTNGRKTLDDLMRLAYDQFQKDGFQENEFRKLASEVAGSDLQSFFRATLDSTESLPIESALEYWNLEWETKKDQPELQLGVELDEQDGRFLVSKVFSGTPAAEAGIAPGDEFIAFDGLRLQKGKALDFVEKMDRGTYPVVLSRLGKIVETNITPSAPLHQDKELKFGSKTEEAKQRWDTWLGDEKESEA